MSNVFARYDEAIPGTHLSQGWMGIRGMCTLRGDDGHMCVRPLVMKDSRDYPHPGPHRCACEHRWPA